VTVAEFVEVLELEQRIGRRKAKDIKDHMGESSEAELLPRREIEHNPLPSQRSLSRVKARIKGFPGRSDRKEQAMCHEAIPVIT